MSRRELGPDHPDVGGRASGLAYWLTEEGKFDEAEQLIDEAIAIRRKALGPEHPQVGSSLTVKANLMVAMKRYDDSSDSSAAEARRILTREPAGGQLAGRRWR